MKGIGLWGLLKRKFKGITITVRFGGSGGGVIAKSSDRERIMSFRRSSRMALCRCRRPYDVSTGQPLRKEPESWLPTWQTNPQTGELEPPKIGGWQPSKIPCRLCNPDYWIKRIEEEIKYCEGRKGNTTHPDKSEEAI